MFQCVYQCCKLSIDASIRILMYRYVSINQMFSVMDKSFKMTFLWKKTLVQCGNSFGSILEDIILSLSVT